MWPFGEGSLCAPGVLPACDECRRGRRGQTQEDGKSKQAVLSTYLCRVSAPEASEGGVL